MIVEAAFSHFKWLFACNNVTAINIVPHLSNRTETDFIKVTGQRKLQKKQLSFELLRKKYFWTNVQLRISQDDKVLQIISPDAIGLCVLPIYMCRRTHSINVRS